MKGGWKFSPITYTRANGTRSRSFRSSDRFEKYFEKEGDAIRDVEALTGNDMVLDTDVEGGSIHNFTFEDSNGQPLARCPASGWELLRYLYKHVPRNARVAVHELNELIAKNL